MKLRRLTPAERIIAWRLASGRLVRNEELYAALYADPAAVSPASVKVAICRLRSAFVGTGLSITTLHGRGIEVDRCSLEQFRSLLAQEIADHIHIKKRQVVTWPTLPPAKSLDGLLLPDRSSAR